MRVISGKLGGRRLRAVPSRKTRPTTDRVKESLFNMIGPYFKGGSFLDLYAGSGSVAIESVSRGIQKAVMVDRQYLAYKTMKSNVKSTKLSDHFSVLKMNAKSALRKLSSLNQFFDYVYLDPPYKKQKMIKDLKTLDQYQLLNDHALVICETDNTVKMKDDIEHYQLLKQKQYGLTILTIYKYLEGPKK